MEDTEGMVWCYPSDFWLSLGILKVLIVPHACLCVCVLHSYKKNKAMHKKNMKKMLYFLHLINIPIGYLAVFKRLRLLLLYEQKQPFFIVEQYKERAQKIHTSQCLKFCLNKYIDWVWPLYIFFPLFEKVHLTVAELNQLRWTFHENFWRYFFSSKLWNFKEHF